MYDINYYNTQDKLAEELSDGELPDLCHKCGRCCRAATTYADHGELLEMVASGHEEATAFLDIFVPYSSQDEALEAVPDQVQQLLNEAKTHPQLNAEKMTFYHCRYVTEEGLCGIYETRPRCCQEAPTHGWSMMPPGCGFEGWQFLQREKQKRMIRDLKTNAYILEQLSPDGKSHPLRPEESLDDLKAMVAERVKHWKAFGAEYW